MISYGCLAIMFLFILIKVITYYVHKRRALTIEQIDLELITLLNHRSERND